MNRTDYLRWQLPDGRVSSADLARRREASAPDLAVGSDAWAAASPRAVASRVARLAVLIVGAVFCLASASAGDDPVTLVPGTVIRWVGAGTESCGLGKRWWKPRSETCFFPIDLRATGEVELVRVRHGQRESVRGRISDYPYPVQRLELADDRQVHLSANDLERVRRENNRIAALWDRDGAPRFDLPMGEPLNPLPAGGRFGAKRILNGEPRSPHSGADYAVPQGTPVIAVSDAVVVLAEEHFFGGKSVFLDHGDGLITMYLHLSEILVNRGQEARRGSIVGKVGQTGRATGPHLHFGVRWHGARIDPGFLLAPERIGEVGHPEP